MHPKICFVIKKLELRRKEQDVNRKTNDVSKLDQIYKERFEAFEEKKRLMLEKEKNLQYSLKFSLSSQTIMGQTRIWLNIKL